MLGTESHSSSGLAPTTRNMARRCRSCCRGCPCASECYLSGPFKRVTVLHCGRGLYQGQHPNLQRWLQNAASKGESWRLCGSASMTFGCVQVRFEVNSKYVKPIIVINIQLPVRTTIATDTEWEHRFGSRSDCSMCTVWWAMGFLPYERWPLPTNGHLLNDSDSRLIICVRWSR